MADAKPNDNKTCVVYDGACVMCQAFVKKVSAAPATAGFLFIPNNQTLPPGVTAAQAQSQLIVTADGGVVYKNAQAVAFLLSRRYNKPIILKIAALPIIKNILGWLYKIVAAERLYIFGPAAMLWWSKLVILAGLWASILLSLPLWMGKHYLPAAPMFKMFFSGAQLGFLELSLFILLIVASILAVVKSRRATLLFFLAIFGLMIFLDINRLQPWAYLYFVILSLFCIYPWQNPQASAWPLQRAVQIILAGVYFWSGVNKINLEFFMRIGPWFMQPLGPLLGGFDFILPALAFLVPFTEMAIGLFLFWPRTQKMAQIAATLTHVFILYSLGPFGYNQNTVVWPWNIVMLTLVWLAWVKPKQKEALKFNSKYYIVLVMVFFLFWIAPILRFVWHWDAFLSSVLYSGSATSAVVRLNPAEPVPAELKDTILPSEEYETLLSLSDWSLKRYNAPLYPEPRVFKKIFTGVCALLRDKNSAELLIHPQPGDKKLVNIYHCSDFGY